MIIIVKTAWLSSVRTMAPKRDNNHTAQHRAIGHVQYTASLRADTPRPRKGRAILFSAPQAARGNCRRHDPHIGIMIHPYDTATHKNERGASPVELPSRPSCLSYSTFLKNNKIYSAFLLKICYDRRQDIEGSIIWSRKGGL